MTAGLSHRPELPTADSDSCALDEQPGYLPGMTAISDLIPIVPCEDIRPAHDFLVGTLGLEFGGVVTDPAGKVVHGEVRAGHRRIWLHAASHGLMTPNDGRDVTTGGIVILVADVDEHFTSVQAAGATILSEPTDQPYRQREYGLRDPKGHTR